MRVTGRLAVEADLVLGGRAAPVEASPRSAPILDRDVDLGAYLEACPPTATTRGTFFQHVRDRVLEREGVRAGSTNPQSCAPGVDGRWLYEGVSERVWSPFTRYPLRDFMKLAYNAATLLYPQVPTAEGLRRIGWLSYESFRATTAGRVVLFAMGQRLEDVLSMAPAAYRIALPSAVVRMSRIDARTFHFELSNVHSFLDSYHYGVIEGACVAFGHQPQVVLEPGNRLCDGEAQVSW
jgi:uncharacterized protein (TIGR02265 family)